MVHVLPDRPHAVRPYKFYRLAATASRAWGSTRIGPWSDPFSAVCRRSPAADKTPPPGSSCVRSCDVDVLSDRMCACADEVLSWMRANRLQANPSKTEVLWCSSGRCQHQIPTTSVQIGTVDVLPVSSVRDLGVYIDSDVAMRSHVTATVRSCFAALRQLRSVWRCLPQQALLTLIRALIISKVDYYCSVLIGVSGHFLDRFQSVLNAAARLVFSTRRSERITPLLRDLHWLRVPERKRFRLCVLTFHCFNGTAPSHLADSICRVADVEGRRHLRSSATATLINPGRPIILCRRSTGMEQSAISRTGCIVAHHLPTRTENISFSLQFSGPLVANSLFSPMLHAGTLLTV